MRTILASKKREKKKKRKKKKEKLNCGIEKNIQFRTNARFEIPHKITNGPPPGNSKKVSGPVAPSVESERPIARSVESERDVARPLERERSRCPNEKI